MFKYSFILSVFLISCICSNAQTYIFAQLNGSPINTTGWDLQGGAFAGNITGSGNQELIVCPVNSPSGSIFYQQPINLSLCNKWKASFDFRISDGSGADGLAFCFLDVPPFGFVTGGGLGIPSSANGLKICFDTWNNCRVFDAAHVHDSMPKIEIRYGAGYNECSSQPTYFNTSGAVNFIRDGNYHNALVQYNNGNIDVYVDGVLYVSGFQTFNFAGYLGFTASTGGYNDNHSIKNVVIYTEMPPSVAGASAIICPNGSVQLGTSSNPSYHYEWTGAAGLNATDISNPIATPDNTGAGILFRKYFVKTSFASNTGCASIDSVTIQINPRPKINFITPAICLTDAFASFKDSSYTNDSSGYPFTYSWDFGDPNASLGNPNSSKNQNPTHQYAAARQYTIKEYVCSAHGCKDSLDKIFTVNGAFPKAAFTIKDSPVICSSQDVVLQNSSTVNFGNITTTEIWWNLLDSPNVVSDDTLPVQNKIYHHRYPLFYGTTSRSYLIKLRVYSGQSCVDEIQSQVIIYPIPHVYFNQLPSVCNDAIPFQITGAYDSSKNNGSGYFLGLGTDSSGFFTPSIVPSGIDSISYFFITDHGCSDSAKSSITVWPLPVVKTGKQIMVLAGGSVLLPATTSGLALQYLWSPSLYLDDPTVLQPLCTPLNDITYTLQATGSGGCIAKDTIGVKVLSMPLIPNTFTPNGDGINDRWEIKYLNSYPECSVDVYNRYGQQVYHSIGYPSPWDGKFKGSLLPIGTYYYIIDPKLGRQIISGYVTIVR